MNYRLLLVLLLFPVQIILAQQTKVQGIVSDQLSQTVLAIIQSKHITLQIRCASCSLDTFP